MSSYLLPKFSRAPFTIVLILLISTMVNGTLLNFGKRYEDDSRVIFDQWPKLHLGLDALSNQIILKCVYYIIWQISFLIFSDLHHMALEHGWLEKILSCLTDQEIEAKKKEFEPKKVKDPRVIRKRTSSIDLTQQSKRSKKTFR